MDIYSVLLYVIYIVILSDNHCNAIIHIWLNVDLWRETIAAKRLRDDGSGGTGWKVCNLEIEAAHKKAAEREKRRA